MLVVSSKISDDFLNSSFHFYHVFTSSAQGGQILFHKPLFCSFVFLITFLVVFTPVSSFAIIFSSPKRVKFYYQNGWGHGQISPPPGSPPGGGQVSPSQRV